MLFSEDQFTLTPEGWWVLKHDSHLSRWVEETKRLDHDQYVLQKYCAPYIKPGTVVYDLGAAIGDHTIFYLNAVGPGGVVVAFEPHPLQYECLRRNCPKALCYPYVVGETEDYVWLFHEPDCIAGSRLIDPSLGWPMTQHKRVIIDKAIDSFKEPVSFMKIDIEGCETEGLRGARETIMRHRPVIWIEINPEALIRQKHSVLELRNLLENELSYRVAEFYPPGGDWNGWQGQQSDALCLPSTL